MSQADLDLTLHRRDAGAYTIDLRYVNSTSEAVNQVSGLAPVCFDDAALRERSLDPAATGVYLAQQLLAGEDVRGFFREALATAEARDLPLSLRLTAGPARPSCTACAGRPCACPAKTRRCSPARTCASRASSARRTGGRCGRGHRLR